MDNSPAGASPSRACSGRREWAPRIWEGCDFFAWARLLVRNRLAVDPRHLYIAFIITIVSLVHTVLRLIQEAFYGDRIRRTVIREDPIFIIGHWRTGTTLLHELLILDDRHSYPTTYECLEPNHFLLTEKLFTRLFRFLMPSRRPMDNMAAGWDRPQEDEFALCMLGEPSPYLTIAFPNHPPQDTEYFDLEGVSAQARERWKRSFYSFLQRITLRNPKRLVLKSPTHTCRVKTLLELFRDARFVHIVRDPYVVFPSTMNLWKSLYTTHGLQKPRFEWLQEYVLRCFTLLYRKLDEARPQVPLGRFHEIRYEDLVRDPLGEMELLYERLDLDNFEQVRPRIEEYLTRNAGYQTNRYDTIAPDLRQEITRRWGDIIHRYGYEDAAAPVRPSTPTEAPAAVAEVAAVSS
jgi:hypothetical protein